MPSDTVTFGSSLRSTTKISRPLSSFAVCTSGTLNARSSPSAGAFVRSSVVSTRAARRFRMEAQQRAVARVQLLVDGGAHVAHADAAVTREVFVELAGIAEEGVALIEQIRLAAESADRFQAGYEPELLASS